MAYLARNISGKYAILLKEQVKPDATIDLETIFEGFCKPKRTAKAGIIGNSEFTRDQFPVFLDWVQDIADPRLWAFEFDGTISLSPAKRNRIAQGSTQKRKRQNVFAVRETRRKMDTAGLTPKQIALLPADDVGKSTIEDCVDLRKLKAALSMAKNLAGQERVRGWLEDRLQELATEGVS